MVGLEQNFFERGEMSFLELFRTFFNFKMKYSNSDALLVGFFKAFKKF